MITEAEAYKVAWECLRPVEGTVEHHLGERAACKIATALKSKRAAVLSMHETLNRIKDMYGIDARLIISPDDGSGVIADVRTWKCLYDFDLLEELFGHIER